MKQYNSNKFNKDGSFKNYRGSTVISKILKGTLENDKLSQIQDRYKALPFSSKYAFLPSESFHMTVIELVNDKVRTNELWSGHLPLDISFDQVEEYFLNNWDKVAKPESIRISVNMISNSTFIYLTVSPFDDNTAFQLTDFRNSIAEVFGVKKPSHDNYKFHITLAYGLYKLTENEQAVIDKLTDDINQGNSIKELDIILPSPELCFYEDMSQFNNAVLT